MREQPMTTQTSPTPSIPNAELYEQDFFLWLQTTATLLKQRRLTELDVNNLIEEIEAMGRNEKRAVESNLEVVLMHLLKYQYQPELRSNSWRYTLREHRKRLRKAFKASPSLKPYFLEIFAECYEEARMLAAEETGMAIATFPKASPFTPENALNPDYLPD
jgi:hypothetical protein